MKVRTPNNCMTRALRRKEEARAWLREHGSRDFPKAVRQVRRNERP